MTSTTTNDATIESTSTNQIYLYNDSVGSHIFGTLAIESDSLSRQTRYFYDIRTGRTEAVIYPNGKGIWYGYDAIGNLTTVLPAVSSRTERENAIPIFDSVYSYDVDSSIDTSVAYAYDTATNRLSTITTESTVYTFTYDVYGNSESIKAGNNTLASYTYHANNGKLDTLTYGNGLSVKYLYDSLDRVSEVWYNTGEGKTFEKVYSYAYDSAGNLYSVTDHTSNEITLYQYDAVGKLVKTYVYDASSMSILNGASFVYDTQSRLSAAYFALDYQYSSNLANNFTAYYYDYSLTTGNLSELRYSSRGLSGWFTPVYDNLGRTSNRTVAYNYDGERVFYQTQRYVYTVSDGGYQSGQISQVISSIGKNAFNTVSSNYRYEYDANGNITCIRDVINQNAVLYRYTYDSLGQLIREDNAPMNTSYTYEYDSAGNRTMVKEYAYTTGTLGNPTYTKPFTYSSSAWGDQMQSFDTYFQVHYDANGNPTGYNIYDTNECYELTWQGRELQQFRYSVVYDMPYPDILVDFTYNADGVRTSKTANGIKHEYTLNGSQVLADRWTEDGEEHLMIFFYDETGAPAGFKFRTSSYAKDEFDFYFYEKNLFGDIIAIYDETGYCIGIK